MQNKEKFLNHLRELIACPSVLSEPKENMPFGEGVYRAYKAFMDIASEMGFETINYDNYMGEIVFGEGEEIGIIGHVDVVPEGEGWNTPPYQLTERDGVYYARGIADDKAPLLVVLYILNELKNSQIKSTKKFRLFVGCDEESGWGDIAYFERNNKFPEYGFSPDGNFPVSYAEKGIARIEITLPKFKRFKEIKGGTVCNAVCGLAEVFAEDSAIDKKLLDKYNLQLDGNKIISVGKSCHGSRPKMGKNAILPLFNYMSEMGEDLAEVTDYLFNDKLCLNELESEEGEVTFSPNIIEEDEVVRLYCDTRIPHPFTLEDVTKRLDEAKLNYTARLVRNPLFVDKNSKLVQTLLNSYRDKFDKNAQPIYQSGGTFAYVFDKGCAFGPEFPSEVSTIHEANESMTDEQLEKIYDIYKEAIFNLAKTDGLK